ncbi:MAG: thymidine phosphorylase [Acidimicrobiia bacterium]|nr:thymidine phosphorylase [Acidimicrobiia bacterium]
MANHSIVELIRRKRDGAELTPDELAWIIQAFTAGDIERYQMSSLLMAILFRGMSDGELGAWTEAMLHSGEVLDLSTVPLRKIDKHSTGGVGDKVSIPLAPIVAACGVAVPMMSGRGLGHTGGTLDKLESIPGFSTNIPPAEFAPGLIEHQLVLAGQTETLVPADKAIYALRDASGTVPSIPLIASSIMSKKLAEDLDGLVLDVKVGSGAFMKTVEEATELAETMAAIGRGHGTTTVAHLTAMDQPLGNKIGNTLEIEESLEILRGGGPKDMIEITRTLAVEMLLLAGVARDADAAISRVRHVVNSGQALQKFRDVVAAQGGDPEVVEGTRPLAQAPHQHTLRAHSDGYVRQCDALAIGMAVVRLGGGRVAADDVIDSTVGVVLAAKVGDAVSSGDELATIHYSTADALASALPVLERAWSISPEPVPVPPLLISRIG